MIIVFILNIRAINIRAIQHLCHTMSITEEQKRLGVETLEYLWDERKLLVKFQQELRNMANNNSITICSIVIYKESLASFYNKVQQMRIKYNSIMIDRLCSSEQFQAFITRIWQFDKYTYMNGGNPFIIFEHEIDDISNEINVSIGEPLDPYYR